MEKGEKIKKNDKNWRQSKIIIKNSYKQKLLLKKKRIAMKQNLDLGVTAASKV